MGESKLTTVTSTLLPFQRFFRTEAAGGTLLLVSAGAALIAANSARADDRHRLWSIPVSIGIMNHSFSLTLHQWINDGLMAIFFLLVGLEIKRELLAGELSSPRQAALPLTGAGRDPSPCQADRDVHDRLIRPKVAKDISVAARSRHDV